MTENDKHPVENLLKHKLSPELFKLITDTFPFLISYVDKNRRYQFHNKEYEKMFGRSYEEIHGKHISDVLGKKAYQHIKPYVDKVLSGERVRYELLLPFKDGERFMDVQYIPDIGENSEVQGFITIVHYLSEGKKSGGPASSFEKRMNEITSSLVELTCLVEGVRIRFDEAKPQLRSEEKHNEKINDLIKKWTADLKKSENTVLKVQAAIAGWIEKNKAA